MDEEKIENSTSENENVEKIIESKRYSITFEMFENAYTLFQKKYVYPRSIVMIILLILLAIGNAVNIIVGRSSGILSYILIMACLALAAINWYNPRKIKKNLMQSIRGIENDVYTLDILPDKLIIGTVIDPVDENDESEPEEYEEVFGEVAKTEEISSSDVYINNTLRVTERKEYFMVYIKKSMFYVIPKSVFTEDEIRKFAMYFAERIDKYFMCEADR